jgi:hypothetical protein
VTGSPKALAWKHSSAGGAAEQYSADGSKSAAPQANWRRLDAPFFYAANTQVLISGNSATLLFTRPHPAVLPDGNIAPMPLREAVALVEMSLTALKELSRAAADVIRRIEEERAETPTASMQSGDAVAEQFPKSAKKNSPVA